MTSATALDRPSSRASSVADQTSDISSFEANLAFLEQRVEELQAENRRLKEQLQKSLLPTSSTSAELRPLLLSDTTHNTASFGEERLDPLCETTGSFLPSTDATPSAPPTYVQSQSLSFRPTPADKRKERSFLPIAPEKTSAPSLLGPTATQHIEANSRSATKREQKSSRGRPSNKPQRLTQRLARALWSERVGRALIGDVLPPQEKEKEEFAPQHPLPAESHPQMSRRPTPATPTSSLLGRARPSSDAQPPVVVTTIWKPGPRGSLRLEAIALSHRI